jgi:hypothetical protein
MIWTFNNAHIFLQITIQQNNFLKYNISCLQDSVGCDTMCLSHGYQHCERICCHPPPSLMEWGHYVWGHSVHPWGVWTVQFIPLNHTTSQKTTVISPLWKPKILRSLKHHQVDVKYYVLRGLKERPISPRHGFVFSKFPTRCYDYPQYGKSKLLWHDSTYITHQCFHNLKFHNS